MRTDRGASNLSCVQVLQERNAILDDLWAERTPRVVFDNIVGRIRNTQQRRRRLVRQVPGLERLLRGSLVERYKKCGKPGCHCVHSKGHGPASYLSVTLGPGKTRSYYVPEEQRRRIERYLGNYRKLREVVEEIIAINRELLERAALDDEG